METRSRLLKKITPIILSLMFAFCFQPAEAQLLKKLKKSAEKSVERKLEKKVEKETDKAMDTILDGNKKTTNKNEETTINEDEKASKNENVLVRGKSDNPTTTSPSIDDGSMNESGSPADENSLNEKPWSKYNFVPGDQVIFQDDLTGEENGEFPSRWDLVKGSAENASFANETIIRLDNESIITPLMKTGTSLPEVFTIEFDAYYDKEPMSSYVYHQIYKLRLWDGPHNINLPDRKGYYQPIKVYRYGATLSGSIEGQSREYEGFEESMKSDHPIWRHIAIAFNKRSLKIFVDEYRALNIPNLGFQPKKISIEGYSHPHGKEDGFVIAIKNIRIAEGGKKLYERVIADGKFVTRGILFDVNKATIKPESMGVLNEIADMMKEHTDLKFSIEGHTDSDGSDDYNQQLSEKRAAAVKEILVSIGIDGARMQTKGIGESVPVSDNTSPEGKANNRRVEFIKI